MREFLDRVLQTLPPLKAPKDPAVASIVGFLTGGIGLGIYFRSFIDMLVPVVLYILLSTTAERVMDFGWVVGAIVAAYHGYERAVHSNTRLADVRAAAP